MELIFSTKQILQNGDDVFISIKEAGDYWLTYQELVNGVPVFKRLRYASHGFTFINDESNIIDIFFYWLHKDRNGINMSVYTRITTRKEYCISLYKLHDMNIVMADEIARLHEQIRVLQEALDRPGNIGATIGWEMFKDAMENQPKSI